MQFTILDFHSSFLRGGGGGGRGSRGGAPKSPPPKPPSSGGGSHPGGTGGRSPSSVNTPNFPPGSRGASSYGHGGGNPVTIPSGSIFAGRTTGSGTREEVFGSRTYGSAYPGQSSRSVFGRNFPFGYWPIVWGVGTIGGAAYLYDQFEYGSSSNSSRPGSPLVQAPLQGFNDSLTTYHLVSDNVTVISVLSALESNCSLSSSTITPVAFNPDNSSEPQPEQAIQYYRASTIVLTLDGYNNTATNSNDTNAVDTPLPTSLNITFLDCLNQTIGASAPIEDAQLDNSTSTPSYPLPGGAPSWQSTASVPVWGSCWLIIVLIHMLF